MQTLATLPLVKRVADPEPDDRPGTHGTELYRPSFTVGRGATDPGTVPYRSMTWLASWRDPDDEDDDDDLPVCVFGQGATAFTG